MINDHFVTAREEGDQSSLIHLYPAGKHLMEQWKTGNMQKW